MKNIAFGLILFISINLSGQTNNSSSALTLEKKEKLIALVDDLLNKVPPVNFTVSSNDAKCSFADMSDEKKYDSIELKKRHDTLSKDTLNPAANYHMADYYSNTNNQVLAKSYYQQSYDNLNIKSFDNDSSAFYSIRAILKYKLGLPNAINDLETSIKINPNDTIALGIYPEILMTDRKFQKAREVLISALDTKPKKATNLYVTLFMIEFFDRFTNIIEKAKSNKNYSKNYSGKNYNEIFDLKLLDKYAKIYQDNHEIVNSRIMIDICLLFCKMQLFEITEDHKVNFNYNTFEMNKMEDIINKLVKASSQKTMNEFSINRSLGFVYFLREEWDKSVHHFNKAIEIAPLNKEDIRSRTAACYDAIMAIYKLTPDNLNYSKTIRRKIDNEPNIENTIDDMVLLAYDHYSSGRIKEAEAYCHKVELKDINNFDASRLKAQINFINGDYHLSHFYIQKAAKSIRSDVDDYNLAMQSAIYHIYNGDMQKAQNILEFVNQFRRKNICSLYDKLTEEYCNVTPQ